MTDQHEPEQGLPTAGRRPPDRRPSSAGQPAADRALRPDQAPPADRASQDPGRPAAERADWPRYADRAPAEGTAAPAGSPAAGDDDEATARLLALPAVGATGDEPTVVQPPVAGRGTSPAGAALSQAGAMFGRGAGTPPPAGPAVPPSNAATPGLGAGAPPPEGAATPGRSSGAPPAEEATPQPGADLPKGGFGGGAPPGPGETTRVIDPPDDEEPTVQQPLPDPLPGATDDLDGPTRRLWDLLPNPAQEAQSPTGAARQPPAEAVGQQPPAEAVGPEPASNAAEQPGDDDPTAQNGPEVTGDAAAEPAPDPATAATAGDAPAVPPWRRLSSAGALIWVLLALFGFTLVVQLRSNDSDQGLATARQEDLVRILSDLEARDSRLQSEITALETSQRQLTSGVAGREAAIAQADKRAEELGLLAGTLPGRGPGLRIVVEKVKASAILNAVQELRGAGGEVMQLAGADGGVVRIVASS